MSATVVLPAVPSLGVNLLEEVIPRVIVSPENGPVSGRDSGFGTSLGNRCVAALGVIGTIGRYLRHVPFDWFEAFRKHFAVVPVGGSDFEPDDVFGRFIHGQMDLAPSAALANPVLTDFPFAFAKDLQPGRIDHDRHRSAPRPTGNLHRQGARTTGQVGVIRHRKVQLAEAHQRLEQAFRGTVGQPEPRFERQTGLYRHVRVPPRLASAHRRRGRPVILYAGFVKPDRQVASIHQSTVVVRPVRHSVAVVYLLRAPLKLRLRCHLIPFVLKKPSTLAKEHYIAPTP